MKYTPYLYILFFFLLGQNIFAQKKLYVSFEGDDENSDYILKQIKYKHEIQNDSLLTIELHNFRRKINQLGFINHKVDTSYTKNQVHHFRFTLYQPIKSIIIHASELPYLSQEIGFVLNNETSIVIPFVETVSFVNKIINYYQNNGFPFVKVYLNNISTNKDQIVADLNISTIQKRSVDKVILKGYTKFPKSYLKHKLGIKDAMSFDKKQILSISEKIQSIPFVSEIRDPELLFQKDSTHLYLYLKKEKSNQFDGLLGLSNTADNKGVQLNGFIDFSIANVFDFGESLRINWLNDGQQSQSLNLSVDTPYILGSPFGLHYDFDIYKKDSAFINRSNHLIFDYQIGLLSKVGFALETTYSSSILALPRDNTLDFSNIFYGIAFVSYRPNKHSIFRKKWEIQSSVLQGKRNNTKQYKFRNHLSYLINLSSSHNIQLRNTTDFLFSKNYIDNELFRIGGSNSIRGFERRSLVAKSYTFFNIEYNYLLGSGSYISILSDYGLLDETEKSSLLQIYSFGVGYTYKIKTGQFGIQYFIGNTDSTPFSFRNSKLHLKIVQDF